MTDNWKGIDLDEPTFPNKGTFCTGAGSHVPYRATFANGIRTVASDDGIRVSSPVFADFEILVYARDDDDAERFAEHYARDYVTPLVALARILNPA